eukprot:CAMPEP_0183341786 /NCGR_PEP_ID=MMETSP0164_2-20130417/8003_1 /TAXON_ID=221442 /ORGANISM="Coccolithus pelagicus ssp braarudi, Strain PLY182g" /LENGTH=157 /DNA_ID=CAMNT_0025512197 /DNA_START=10 /DNA_END=483 /DNA_ORIENTATION=+
MSKRAGLVKVARRGHSAKSMGASKERPGGAQKSSLKKRRLRLKGRKLTSTAVAAAAVVADDDMFAKALAPPVRFAPSISAVEPAVERPAAFENEDKNELFRRVVSMNGAPSGMIAADEHRSRQDALKSQKTEKRLRKAQLYERLAMRGPRSQSGLSS